MMMLFLKKREEELNNQISVAELFPQESLKKMGLLPKGSNKGTVLVGKLLQIFKVQNLNQVLGLYNLEFDCKISDKLAVNEYALVTWMRLGELEAEKICNYGDLPPFDLKKLMSNLDNIKRINLEINLQSFISDLQNIYKSLGLIFVVVPEIKGSRISGMARWLKVGKRKIPMIQLSLRGKKHDMFWFTFSHELGHIVLHKNETYVDLENRNLTNTKEEEADEFSRNALIPEQDYLEFINDLNPNKFTTENIRKFARKLGIHPGILVRRLQKEGLIAWNRLNTLKTTYKWDFEN